MHTMQPYLENIKKYSKTTLLVVCLLATAIFWHYRGQHTPLIAATEIPAEPLPSFQLLTTDNQALTPESFLGQWTFLFFGYTSLCLYPQIHAMTI
jgi:cytochrome oxidase Cu insertion factor (SCO1/SenC/PrrC family)